MQQRKTRKGSLVFSALLALMVLFMQGCVFQTLSADKTRVKPGEEVSLTSTCLPSDDGSYKYMWFCVNAPLTSQWYSATWIKFAEGSSQALFTPDVVGTYVIECKVFAGVGGSEGFNIKDITIECYLDTGWEVAPTVLDYGLTQTQQKVYVTNTGDVPISVALDEDLTAPWCVIAGDEVTIQPNEATEIVVTVDRSGMINGHYTTTFDVVSPECGAETITVSMDVPDIYSWDVAPTELDFGYIQVTKTVTVTNTSDTSYGEAPLTVSIDDSTLADWAAVSFTGGSLEAGTSRDITVTVDRTGLAWGTYTTTFSVGCTELDDDVIITINMNVGEARLLFVVDTSGSMAQNDPADKRVEAVFETIDLFYPNEHVSFGIVRFSTTAATLSAFTRDLADLEGHSGALAQDSGWTTYLGDGASYDPGALDLVDDLVDQDDGSIHFVTLFLSDGEPTQGNTNHDSIVAMVTSLVAGGNAKLYTIYLNGDPEDTAEALLNDMAIAGGTEQTHVYTDPDSLTFIDLDF